MSLRIATNVTSLNAQRNLHGTRRALDTSLARLSSGFRINQAADDAAGLAISENLKAEIRGIKQAGRNAQDGVSMVQVAEGALNEVSSMLIRLRELAVQSSSDTIGPTERQFIDVEYQQLKNEIQRISEITNFNGTSLLNGTGGILDIQVGTGNDPFKDRLSFDTSAADSGTSALGLIAAAVGTKEEAQLSLDVVDSAIVSVNAMRANFGALQNRLLSGINNIQVAHENLSAANSRIRDADIAAESAEFTRNSILTQAGVSVLSQANQIQQIAVKLIG